MFSNLKYSSLIFGQVHLTVIILFIIDLLQVVKCGHNCYSNEIWIQNNIDKQKEDNFNSVLVYYDKEKQELVQKILILEIDLQEELKRCKQNKKTLAGDFLKTLHNKNGIKNIIKINKFDSSLITKIRQQKNLEHVWIDEICKNIKLSVNVFLKIYNVLITQFLGLLDEDGQDALFYTYNDLELSIFLFYEEGENSGTIENAFKETTLKYKQRVFLQSKKVTDIVQGTTSNNVIGLNGNNDIQSNTKIDKNILYNTVYKITTAVQLYLVSVIQMHEALTDYTENTELNSNNTCLIECKVNPIITKLPETIVENTQQYLSSGEGISANKNTLDQLSTCNAVDVCDSVKITSDNKKNTSGRYKHSFHNISSTQVCASSKNPEYFHVQINNTEKKIANVKEEIKKAKDRIEIARVEKKKSIKNREIAINEVAEIYKKCNEASNRKDELNNSLKNKKNNDNDINNLNAKIKEERTNIAILYKNIEIYYKQLSNDLLKITEYNSTIKNEEHDIDKLEMEIVKLRVDILLLRRRDF